MKYIYLNNPFTQSIGMMFKPEWYLKGKVYVFRFKTPVKYMIHGYFCACSILCKFYLKHKIVDIVIIHPYEKYTPTKEYDRLEERII